MRTIFFFICMTLLTGCYTSSLLNNAKLDFKKERVDSLIAHKRDTSGNLNIWFTKAHGKAIHKLTIPLAVNDDSLSLPFGTQNDSRNFIGIFHAGPFVRSGPVYSDLILLNNDSVVKQVSFEHTGYDTSYSLQKLSQRITIEAHVLNSRYKGSKFGQLTKAVAFVLTKNHPGAQTNTNSAGYIIALKPSRRKFTRYLLLPVAITADIITGPFQLFGLGLAWLFKDIPISKINQAEPNASAWC